MISFLLIGFSLALKKNMDVLMHCSPLKKLLDILPKEVVKYSVLFLMHQRHSTKCCTMDYLSNY